MHRRTLLVGGLGVLSAPRAVGAQPGARVHRIAIVVPSGTLTGLTETGHPAFRVLFAELRRRGYIEGQTLLVERRSGEGRAAEYPELARQVVQLQPDVIYVISTQMALALRAATTTIPIVAFTGDPIAAGLVASLARPSGNLTGFSDDAGLGILGKRLELLRETVRSAGRIGVLVPSLAWEGVWGQALRPAAPPLGATLLGAPVGGAIGEAEYRRAFASLRREGAEAVFVGDQLENFTHRRLIVALAAQARLPAVYAWRDAVEAGGLMAYGIRFADVYRGVAGYLDRILTGTAPGDLPYQQPTSFELVINTSTAKALGLTIPQSVLARADELIQ